MDKPKGGRGKTAPYDTKQIRIPVGLEPQIQELIARYREWISQSGSSVVGTNNPPRLLDKPVDNFKETNAFDTKPVDKLKEPKSQSLEPAAKARSKKKLSSANAAALVALKENSLNAAKTDSTLSAAAEDLVTAIDKVTGPAEKKRLSRRKLKGDQLSLPVDALHPTNSN